MDDQTSRVLSVRHDNQAPPPGVGDDRLITGEGAVLSPCRLGRVFHTLSGNDRCRTPVAA